MRVCSEITVLEEVKVEISRLKESKFNTFKILLKTTNDIFSIQSTEC